MKKIKIVISSALVLLSLTLALVKGGISWLFFLGMSASWLGDMTLGQLKPICKWTRHSFTGGMAAFAAAHGFYIAGLALGVIKNDARYGVLVVSLVILLAAAEGYTLYASLQRPKIPLSLKISCGVYISLVCIVAALGLGLAALRMGLWPLGAGGLLFLASDLILGGHRIGGWKVPMYELAVWGTYGPAQLLLIIGGALL